MTIKTLYPQPLKPFLLEAESIPARTESHGFNLWAVQFLAESIGISGAESANGNQPRATPWDWRSVDWSAPWRGAGSFRPCRADLIDCNDTRGVAPGCSPSRRWREITAAFSINEICKI